MLKQNDEVLAALDLGKFWGGLFTRWCAFALS